MIMVHRSRAPSAVLAIILAGALALALRPAAAAYPERYITIICASGAGGIVDVTTRILAEHMSRTLGRNVVVQNEPGAGSTLAIAAVAKAAPDGYTVLTIGPGVSVVAELTHKDVPVTDYAALVPYLKAHPGELTTGSNGRGSAGHLAGALFKNMAGVDIRYIPYRTTPQAQTDLLAGRLSMMWLSSLSDHSQIGTVHPIAVSTLERWNQFPDTPSFDELGLKGYEATTWISMYLPKGAPREIGDRLTAALDAALADPALRARLDQAGIVAPRSTGPDFLDKYLRLEIGKWADILRTNKDTD
jgi:tripartite-type tricarboxylate transporter receptor subunit TctC